MMIIKELFTRIKIHCNHVELESNLVVVQYELLMHTKSGDLSVCDESLTVQERNNVYLFVYASKYILENTFSMNKFSIFAKTEFNNKIKELTALGVYFNKNNKELIKMQDVILSTFFKSINDLEDHNTRCEKIIQNVLRVK